MYKILVVLTVIAYVANANPAPYEYGDRNRFNSGHQDGGYSGQPLGNQGGYQPSGGQQRGGGGYPGGYDSQRGGGFENPNNYGGHGGQDRHGGPRY